MSFHFRSTLRHTALLDRKENSATHKSICCLPLLYPPILYAIIVICNTTTCVIAPTLPCYNILLWANLYIQKKCREKYLYLFTYLPFLCLLFFANIQVYIWCHFPLIWRVVFSIFSIPWDTLISFLNLNCLISSLIEHPQLGVTNLVC